jgi:hypothetical protein
MFLYLVICRRTRTQPEILQLHEIDVARRVREIRSSMSKNFAAPRFPMQRHQQGMLRTIRSGCPRADNTASSSPAHNVYLADSTTSLDACRATALQRRISSIAWRRRPATSIETVSRICAARSSSDWAACTSGFSPIPSAAHRFGDRADSPSQATVRERERGT